MRMNFIVVIILIGILIAGAAFVFMHHRGRAAMRGVHLKWGDIFTGGVRPDYHEREVELRHAAGSAVRRLFVYWLIFCFVVFLVSTSFFYAEAAVPARIEM